MSKLPAPPVVLTIAGSDPSGGAGLQADLKTFHQHGVYGMAVVTLVTVQNTLGVAAVETLAPELAAAQIDAVLEDIPPQAAKTGALGNAAVIDAVASRAAAFSFPLVVDPVIISKHGHRLMDDHAVDALIGALLPHAQLVTPNRAEAERLTGRSIADRRDAVDAAERIARLGPAAVLLKASAGEDSAVDLLWHEGEIRWLHAPRKATSNLHGSGCVLAAAIAARLAWGDELASAAAGAKRFVTAAIASAPKLGGGIGPLNLHVAAPGPEATSDERLPTGERQC